MSAESMIGAGSIGTLHGPIRASCESKEVVDSAYNILAGAMSDDIGGVSKAGKSRVDDVMV